MHLPKLFKRTRKSYLPQTEELNPLTLEQLKKLYKAMEEQGAFLDQQPVQGDGKATLLEPMTDSEFAQWEHENDRGWKKVYDRILRRGEA